ncbi:MAG: hypothetical protein LIP16_02005 [Clostridium sp.]|nr:hypothetical protein [Clostridium sp.]
MGTCKCVLHAVSALLPLDQQQEVRFRQGRDNYDGKFYVAVKSTKIVCRPSCSSRTPLEKNMVFFDTLEEALKNGYRPCRRCKPEYN